MAHSYSSSRSFSFRWPGQWPAGLPQNGRSDFRSGREALYALARYLKPAGGRGTLLLPAWVPEGVYLPFQLADWEIHYYNLQQNGDPEWKEIKHLLQKQSFDLIVLIHYFGQERDRKRLLEILPPQCKLLEDWAHSYPHAQWLPPTQGHWALFSPTKLVGTTDGAWLLGPAQVAPPDSSSQNHYTYLFWQLLYLLGSSAQHLGLPGQKWWTRLRGGAYQRAYQQLVKATATPQKMSLLGKWLLRHTPHQKVVNRRREQAIYYHQQLQQQKVRSLLKDNFRNHPLIGYPVWVDNREHFATYLAKHRIRGQIFTDRWWFISPDQEASFRASKSLMDHHYLLPINPFFKEKDLQRIVQTVNRYPGP